jgi:hypothetical protein
MTTARTSLYKTNFSPVLDGCVVEKSGVQAATNTRKAIGVGPVLNENWTDTNYLLVLDKTRYQRNAVQALAAQSGITLAC